MSHLQRQVIFFAVGLLLITGCTWWWFATMEKRWTSRPQVSTAAQENPMLGATRLLSRHQHTVKTVGTLAETLHMPLPDGTLVLAENSGIVTDEQAAQLLAWVRRGNTLIFRPQWSNRTRQVLCGERVRSDSPESVPDADAANADPIGAYLGVELVEMMRRTKEESNKAPETPPQKAHARPSCLARITLPEAGYALQLDIGTATLQSSKKSLTPLFGDDNQEAVRVYTADAGHIAVIADNYFDNRQLPMYDHAELLLTLAHLNRSAKHVLIVQHLDMPSWYQALWWHFQLGIVSLGCGLLLLFWLGVRRFGPILPEPSLERRSLIEHINASGRWLWKAPGGRDILLAATRDSTKTILLRKAPGLLRLPPAEQVEHLARHCNLPHADIASAWLQPASRLPIDFTRQIQTLQQLRKHYER